MPLPNMGLLLGVFSASLQQPSSSAPSPVSSRSVDVNPRPLSTSEQRYFEVVLGRSFAATGYPLPDNQLAHLVSFFLDSGFADLPNIGAERQISTPTVTSSSSLESPTYRMPNIVYDRGLDAALPSNLLPFGYQPAQRQLLFSTSASRPNSNTSSTVHIEEEEEEEEEEAPRIPQASQEEDMNTDNALRQELLNHTARFHENLLGEDAESIELNGRLLAQPARVGEDLIHIGERIISDFQGYEDHVKSTVRQLGLAFAAVNISSGRGGAQWAPIISSQNAAFEATHAEMCRFVRAQDRMRGLIRIRKQELGILSSR